MEGLSVAASVIAVIQLTGSVVKLCGGYIKEVKDARQDITNLQQVLGGLYEVLQKLWQLLDGPDGRKLSTSEALVTHIPDCHSLLENLEKDLSPRWRQKAWKKLHLQSLIWPLKHDNVERTIKELERYKALFFDALQIDHMYGSGFWAVLLVSSS